MSSIDQRVMEDYQRRKAEYAQALAVRKATKRSLGTAHAHLLNDTAPAPTAPRKPRRPKNARSNKGPKDMPEEPEDEEDREQVQRRFNDINATHTSFRLDDAESICYLSLAINNLTGRTVSDAQAQLGKEYLLRYLDDFAQVRIFDDYSNKTERSLRRNVVTRTWHPTIILLHTYQSNVMTTDPWRKFGHMEVSDSTGA